MTAMLRSDLEIRRRSRRFWLRNAKAVFLSLNRVAVVLGFALTVGCASRENGFEEKGGKVPREVRKALIAEVRRKVAVATISAPVEPSTIVFTRDSSHAVSGLIYYSALFSPKSVGDGFAEAVAGTYHGRMLMLTNANSWHELVRDWRPPDASHALEACAEVIRRAGPRRDSRAPAIIYTDTSVLRLIVLSARDTTRDEHIKLPVAHRIEDGWSVTVAAFEPGAASVYECIFGARRSYGGFRFTQLKHLPGAGRLPLGP